MDEYRLHAGRKRFLLAGMLVLLPFALFYSTMVGVFYGAEITMLFASLSMAVLVASLGIIGFVGLVVPHLVRLKVGLDNRFVLPCSLVCGALLLLVADTVARSLVPVSILTMFLGAPFFLTMLPNRRDA